jgi:hypothetical protein
MAQYKLTEPAYLLNVLWPEGAVVEVPDTLVPGPHMIPMDSAAKKMCKSIPGFVNERMPDPLNTLTPAHFGASPDGVKSGMLAGEEAVL